MEDYMSITYLKLQNKTVMEYDMDTGYYKVLEKGMLPFRLRGKIENVASEKENGKIASANKDAMMDFFSNRKLSVERTNAKEICKYLNVELNDKKETAAKIMMLCKGLSAVDDYWIAADNANQKAQGQRWEEVNVRDNPLHETLAYIALHGNMNIQEKVKQLTITGKRDYESPELTGQGSYAKAWYRDKGTLYLYKGDRSSNRETRAEASVSRIMDCFNVPHVHYDLVKKDGVLTTKCKLMNNSEYSIVDAIDIDSYCIKQDGKSVFEYAEDLNPDLYNKTIVMDYLCSNVDRHLQNWGFLMNNKTGEIADIHPLFDHNNAFTSSCIKTPTEVPCQMRPGKNLKVAARAAIKKCDIRCIKPVTRNMFIDEIAYQSFMSRAVELGLYKKRELSLLEKLSKNKNDILEYEPIAIRNDNTQKYWKELEMKLAQQITTYEHNHRKQNVLQETVGARQTIKTKTGETLVNRCIDLTVKNSRTMGIREGFIAAKKEVLNTDEITRNVYIQMMRRYVLEKTNNKVLDPVKYIGIKVNEKIKARKNLLNRSRNVEHER